MTISRGGIYLAALDPVVGRELSKTRPVVVVSNDKNNQFSGTIAILPVTSKNIRKMYPLRSYYTREPGIYPRTRRLKQIRFERLTRVESLPG